MADDSYNIIKPVEGLPNITGLTPVKRRDQRRRRRRRHKNDKRESEEPGESLEKPDLGKESEDARRNGDGDSAGIDYCA